MKKQHGHRKGGDSMSDVWLYARGSDAKERDLKLQTLQQQAKELGLKVAGSSADGSGGPLLLRPGLRQAVRSIKAGKAGALFVSGLSSISSSNRRLLALLKTLQAHHAKLYTAHTQLEYEIYSRGLEKALRSRADRYDGFLPY